MLKNNNIYSNNRYDSRYDSQYKEKIGELVELILEKGYGGTIPNTEACKVLGYNIDNEEEFKKYKSTMQRVKNFLIDYGCILKSIAGIGYYILQPKQISSHCYRTYIDRTKNLLEKSERILNHVDKLELSEIRMEEYNDVLNLNTKVYEAIGEQIKTSGYYLRKTYYDNLTD